MTDNRFWSHRKTVTIKVIYILSLSHSSCMCVHSTHALHIYTSKYIHSQTESRIHNVNRERQINSECTKEKKIEILSQLRSYINENKSDINRLSFISICLSFFFSLSTPPFLSLFHSVYLHSNYKHICT